jgi:hypothetical protein
MPAEGGALTPTSARFDLLPARVDCNIEVHFELVAGAAPTDVEACGRVTSALRTGTFLLCALGRISVLSEDRGNAYCAFVSCEDSSRSQLSVERCFEKVIDVQIDGKTLGCVITYKCL